MNYLNPDGSIAQPMAMPNAHFLNLLYGSMRRHFPAEHYHVGKQLSDIQQTSEQVTATFTMELVTADLLIGADGPNSTVRHQFLPDVHYHMPGMSPIEDWSTKQIWRQRLLLFTERFVFYQFPNSHILQYVILVSTNLWSLDSAFNWVWYVNYDQATELPRILTDKMAGKRLSDSTGLLAPM